MVNLIKSDGGTSINASGIDDTLIVCIRSPSLINILPLSSTSKQFSGTNIGFY